MRRIPNFGLQQSSTTNNITLKRFKKVVDIIRDNTHPQYNNPNDIGRVFFIDELSGGDISSAIPKDRNVTKQPLIGELIEVELAPLGDSYYPELGGNINNRENYYTNPISVHNNIGSNSLPSPSPSRKRVSNTDNIHSDPTPFNFRKEFINASRENARSELDEYLRGLGYPSGRNDRNAPTYVLSQKANGDYVFRLEDSEDNRQKSIKLGNYFTENPNARPLKINEGDVVFQGRNRQSIQFTSTTPEGESPWSNGVTDAVDDGNPTIGDPVMIFRVGHPYEWRGEMEEPNINNDASSIYMFSNQKLDNFIPADNNVDSLKSTYEEIQDPYEVIAQPPAIDLVVDDQIALEVEQTNIFDVPDEAIEEPIYQEEPATVITSSYRDEDPVFAALDESADENLLSYQEFEADDADFEVIYGDRNTPDTFTPDYGTGIDYNGATAPAFDFSGKDISYLGISNFIYPTSHGKLGNLNGNNPYPEVGWGEFGGFRGVYGADSRTPGEWRYHYGVDIIPFERGNPIPLYAITDAEVLVVRGAGGSNSGFTCADGAQNNCGGFYGNHIIIRFSFNPNFAALYGHCKFGSNRFNRGDLVKKGDIIGNLGNSGRSSGPHLHFEMIEDPTGNQFRNGGWYNRQWKRNPQSIFTAMRKGRTYDFR